MDLSRYLDLYLAEAHEHLRVLGRALLELEGEGAAGALEEAFRAAHTLKGMSAAMGYRAVTEIAHELEDRLDELRSGRRAIDREVVDRLLAEADALERAVEEAALGASPAGGPEGGEAEERGGTSEAPAERAVDAVIPEGTGLVARVVLRRDAPLKGARAAIVLRNVGRVGQVLGSSPAELGEEFDGEFRLFLAPGADVAALEEAIRAAGDVESVVIEPVGGRAEGSAVAARRGSEPRARRRYVRVDQRHLDNLADRIGEMAILGGRLEQLVAVGHAGEVRDVVERLGRLIDELQHEILAVRMVPVAEVFDRFPRLVREAARALGKEVEFEIEGREIELDRAILEGIADPLVHLLRNAVSHGIEPPAERLAAGKPSSGRLVLRAVGERTGVRIEVEDDGRGVPRARVVERAERLGLLPAGAAARASEIPDEELLRLMSHPGLTTAEEVTEVSGRGVGLDVVANQVRMLGGAIELRTREGEGTTFALHLPLTLAVAQALRVRVDGEDYAIPLTHVAEAVELDARQVGRVRGKELLRLRGEVIPLIRLRAVLQARGPGVEKAAVVTRVGERRTALAVDELLGREQIVVKGFDAAAGTLPIFSGVTMLADGRPALVLDPVSVS
ncbi:MAG TPA: chemotaxis protein CheA [Longimicrobiales bacterium]